jgi:hypothetical protein
MVISGGGVFGTYVDIDGSIRGEAELVNKYREIAEHPEVESAIDDVVNEAIVIDDDEDIIQIDLDKAKIGNQNIPVNIQKLITDEFDNVLNMLGFRANPYEIFKRWYIDGRIYFHAVVDPARIKLGIQELRYIDPRKIRKIRETKKELDPLSGATITKVVNEYYIYNEKGFGNSSSGGNNAAGSLNTGIRIAKDAIIQVTSGLSSSRGDLILSYLHKAIKPVNMLRSMEDALVIYRISRSAERRLFYIETGHMPTMKATQYMRDQATKYKNKVVYDSETGQIKSDRKWATMLEDFYISRRNGQGDEITTLPSGGNLSQMDDVLYFKRNLYRCLNIPVTRIDPDSMYNYGRENELTRDEVKFSKFIMRLRSRFATLFTKILERQLVLKGIMSIEEFNSMADGIKYNFAKDNYWEELKETQIITERMNVLQAIAPWIGRFYSNKWVRQIVLKQTEEEMAEMDMEIIEEMSNPQYLPPEEDPESQQARGMQMPQQEQPQGKPQ